MSNETLPKHIPADATCAECGHVADHHRFASNCDVCIQCERHDGVFEPRAWHRFTAIELAGGALSASQEQEAYFRAMRGEA